MGSDIAHSEGSFWVLQTHIISKTCFAVSWQFHKKLGKSPWNASSPMQHDRWQQELVCTSVCCILRACVSVGTNTWQDMRAAGPGQCRDPSPWTIRLAEVWFPLQSHWTKISEECSANPHWLLYSVSVIQKRVKVAKTQQYGKLSAQFLAWVKVKNSHYHRYRFKHLLPICNKNL